jgi:hypothetical protein
MMGYGYMSGDQTDASNNDIDVDSGDLSAWEYLTANFDDDGFLQEHDCCTELQFGTNNVIDMKSNDLMQQAIQSSDERLYFSCPQLNRHLRDDDVPDERFLRPHKPNISIGKLLQRPISSA